MKKKFLLFILGILLIINANAQTANAVVDTTIYDVKNDKYTFLNNLNVLIDRNYSFLQILNDSNLRFAKAEKISVKNVNFYWIKHTVKNSTAYDKKIAVWAYPAFDCELFYFDENTKKWQSVRGGELFANNKTVFKHTPCTFKSNKTTTFYIKVNVTAINTQNELLKPEIAFENEEIRAANRNKGFNWWLATVVIVLAFLVYNAYWYLMIKEKVYLYYLVLLAGGMVYITCANFFVSLFISAKRINARIIDDSVTYIPIEYMLMQLSTIVIIIGFVQFTRIYLQTKNHFPFWDKILKIGLFMFALGEFLFTAAEYFLIIYNNPIYNHILNTVTFIIICLIIFVGIKGYRQKMKQAKYFLMALILPLLSMLALIVLLSAFREVNALGFLPNIAALSITITFAIALVARVNLIKEALSIEKLEKEAIATSIIIEKERNLRLSEKIEHDKVEIAAAQHIKLLMKELHHRVKNNLQIVSSLLSLQSFRIKDQAAIDAVKEGQHRIEAMSLIHQRLYVQDNVTQVNIKEFIADISESLMQAYGYGYTNFSLQLSITDELMEVDKAIPLSIILNELITNAFKYAYLDVEKPSLTISLTKKLTNAELLITDNGKGINIEAWQTNDGYGKELVQTFTEQLEGTLTLSVNNGTTFKIVFPF